MPVNTIGHVEQVRPDLSAVLFVPHSEDEYQRLVTLLDALIDRVGEDETHLLASLLKVVATLIERHGEEYVPELA